ncbi:hypothetical protein EN828_11280 [Mesorhizobium sp. M2D.F.Ca.ET.185.01.1.1]|uniref:hypothetical protein n=2 Tax=Mesorhizobium TaxID=68287 RepID=UPI000FCCAD5D|nr:MULTISPECIES: hypothetical protein [unclassified Mesorhizobium]RVD59306.1 hypothetical protein EN783_11885 [Mesorhizobium sp. M2D.F.Ca.ET.140.01.1.1]TGP17076.1 hypothetical protein EN876_14205 [Mesorhizobium sp. M2D.F.Ca.ET.233.01.1.1]TGP33376.1 hypothetical protein EN875_015665 [Mesorhizobium sp. M2D.F.Ca.ET.232.01.1.1]TGP52868.1 hypothetical protein EN873_16595 [bacterium M00.F.Ca.ET.230.01.1.1]TGP59326.1 hypothetical protein EN869_013675 [Mesorhizobium sp. M2D.F.Ca.ET.226.01.1.1]TGP7771
MIKPLQTRYVCIALAALAGALLAGTALADDSRSQKLPGVGGDYRIAKPAPQPEPDDPEPAGSDGSFKIGNTDVRIGGSITIDMATGGTKVPSH